MIEAVRSGRLDRVKALLEHFPKLIHERDASRKTPLHWAARNNDSPALEYLIEKGADVNALDDDRATPLVTALANGHRSLVKTLIHAGSDVHLKNVFNMSALHYAIQFNFFEESKIILDQGGDLNSKIYNGKTALHLACQGGNSDIVRRLLAGGAKTGESDRGGNTPLHTAVYYGDVKAVEALIHDDADPNVKNLYGQTPLHLAAASGYGEIARLLLGRGASVEAKDDPGRTPLDLAMAHGNEKLVDVLSPFLKQKDVFMKRENFETKLNRELKPGEAIIWYLGNCGWAVKTKSRLLVFDYWNYGARPDQPSLANGRLSRDEIKLLDLVFFISHEHYDHYDKSIFDMEGASRNAKYVFGWKALDNPRYSYFHENRLHQVIDGVEVSNVYYNAESGFLVCVDGVTIYHGGDYQGDFKRDFDDLSQKRNSIDILFSDYEYHEDVCAYAIEKLNPKVAFSMHQDDCEYWLKKEAQELSLKYPRVKFLYAVNRGDCFFYKKDGVH